MDGPHSWAQHDIFDHFSPRGGGPVFFRVATGNCFRHFLVLNLLSSRDLGRACALVEATDVQLLSPMRQPFY